MTFCFVGVANITALGNVINWQKLEYDFNFHKQDFHTNIITLVLSEGKSILKVSIRTSLFSTPNNVLSLICAFYPKWLCFTVLFIIYAVRLPGAPCSWWEPRRLRWSFPKPPHLPFAESSVKTTHLHRPDAALAIFITRGHAKSKYISPRNTLARIQQKPGNKTGGLVKVGLTTLGSFTFSCGKAGRNQSMRESVSWCNQLVSPYCERLNYICAFCGK